MCARRWSVRGQLPSVSLMAPLCRSRCHRLTAHALAFSLGVALVHRVHFCRVSAMWAQRVSSWRGGVCRSRTHFWVVGKYVQGARSCVWRLAGQHILHRVCTFGVSAIYARREVALVEALGCWLSGAFTSRVHFGCRRCELGACSGARRFAERRSVRGA